MGISLEHIARFMVETQVTNGTGTIAEMDFEALEMYSSLQDVLYYKAIVLETLGRKEERDAACEKHEQIQAQQKQLATVVVDREVSEICDAIVLIGAAISRR